MVVHGEISLASVLDFDDEAFGGIGKLYFSHVGQLIIGVLHDQDAVIFSFVNPMPGCKAIFELGKESGAESKVEHISHNYKLIYLFINQPLNLLFIFDAIKSKLIKSRNCTN